MANSSSTSIIIPTIQRELGLQTAQLQWIVSSYPLSAVSPVSLRVIVLLPASSLRWIYPNYLIPRVVSCSSPGDWRMYTGGKRRLYLELLSWQYLPLPPHSQKVSKDYDRFFLQLFLS